jgi:hypothetical protein
MIFFCLYYEAKHGRSVNVLLFQPFAGQAGKGRVRGVFFMRFIL